MNNIAERDQFLGRPIINVTDEGHIITKNPLLAPYVVKITKMRCKREVLAGDAEPRRPAEGGRTEFNMIEWWICLSVPRPMRSKRSSASGS